MQLSMCSVGCVLRDDADEIYINIEEKDMANVYIWIYYFRESKNILCQEFIAEPCRMANAVLWGVMEEVVNAWDQIVHCIIVTLHGLLTQGGGTLLSGELQKFKLMLYESIRVTIHR